MEEIEVRLEALENDTEACFSEDNNIIDLTSDDSSAGDKSKVSTDVIGGGKNSGNTTGIKSNNASKDAHTRQRLSLMVASLQNAARYGMYLYSYSSFICSAIDVCALLLADLNTWYSCICCYSL